MAEPFVNRSIADVCTELCSLLNDGAYLVNPSSTVIDEIAETGYENPDLFPSLRILAEEWTLKQSLSQFTVASRIADLIEADTLEIRYLPNPPKSSLAVDDEQLLVLIDIGDSIGSLSTTDSTFVDDVTENCARLFADAEQYVLHTPPISRVKSTLEDRLGSDRREAFVSFVDASVAHDGLVDEVVISLLVAAKHRDLLYDISKWGEDIGLASKATFSRKKTNLEKHGIIDTDPEPIDVGRPRLRLRFADPALETATPRAVIQELSSRVR